MKTTASKSIRVTKLIGMDVHNQENEKIGAVQDIVVDDEGQVQYAALKFSTFLGLGKKLFAIPWEEVEFKTGVQGEHKLILDVSKQQLKSVDGFDDDDWPEIANEEKMADLHEHHGGGHSEEQ